MKPLSEQERRELVQVRAPVGPRVPTLGLPVCVPDLALIFLSHNMVELSQLAQGIGLASWSAIATFHALA